MKDVFIVNPKSGKNSQYELIQEIKEHFQGKRIIIEKTKGPEHATFIAKKYALSNEPVHLYVCGGDGTLHEVINGCAEKENVTKNQIVEIEGTKYAFDENGDLIKNAEKDGYKIDENGVATEVTPSEETTPTQDTTTQSQTQAPAQTTTQSAPAQSTTTTTQAPAQTSTPSAPANDYVAPTPSVNSSAIAAAALAQVGTTQDCTMLVTNALRAVGINFHGWPENYLSLGTITSSPVAGDIIVYSGHVAIYIGNGQAVHGGWNGSQTVVASVSCDKALIGYVHVG